MEWCHPHSHGPTGGNYSQVFHQMCLYIFMHSYICITFNMCCAVEVCWIWPFHWGIRPRALCTLGNIPSLVFKVYSCVYLCTYAVFMHLRIKDINITAFWLKLHTYQLTVPPPLCACLCMCLCALRMCLSVTELWTKGITSCRPLLHHWATLSSPFSY